MLSSPLGSSDPNLIFILSFFSNTSLRSLKRRCLWRIICASWKDLRRYYVDFPWNYYHFHVSNPSLCWVHNRCDSVWHGGSILHFFLNLNLSNLDLTQPVLALYMRGCPHKVLKPSITWISWTSYFCLESCQIYSLTCQTLSLIKNVKNFQTQAPLEISTIWQKDLQ